MLSCAGIRYLILFCGIVLFMVSMVSPALFVSLLVPSSDYRTIAMDGIFDGRIDLCLS